MTTTVGIYTVELSAGPGGIRAFAEVLSIVTLAAILLQRESLRDRRALWAQAGAASLTAMAFPLVIAWATITFRRFLDLLS